jgi:hypothetical protein
MSERYTKSKLWEGERAMQVRQVDKRAYTRDISKHQGVRLAVEHLQEQLLLPTTLKSAPASAVKQAEQAALQALDQLHVTLGSLLKIKGKQTSARRSAAWAPCGAFMRRSTSGCHLQAGATAG